MESSSQDYCYHHHGQWQWQFDDTSDSSCDRTSWLPGWQPVDYCIVLYRWYCLQFRKSILLNKQVWHILGHNRFITYTLFKCTCPDRPDWGITSWDTCPAGTPSILHSPSTAPLENDWEDITLTDESNSLHLRALPCLSLSWWRQKEEKFQAWLLIVGWGDRGRDTAKQKAAREICMVLNYTLANITWQSVHINLIGF